LHDRLLNSGKKGSKKGGKDAEKDADIKAMSAVNSNLWQARLEVIEQSRIEHRCYCFSSSFLLYLLFLIYLCWHNFYYRYITLLEIVFICLFS